VAVLVPAGRYVLRKDIKITTSGVVLRGAGVSSPGGPLWLLPV
jgi:hypothetical protein